MLPRYVGVGRDFATLEFGIKGRLAFVAKGGKVRRAAVGLEIE